MEHVAGRQAARSLSPTCPWHRLQTEELNPDRECQVATKKLEASVLQGTACNCCHAAVRWLHPTQKVPA